MVIGDVLGVAASAMLLMTNLLNLWPRRRLRILGNCAAAVCAVGAIPAGIEGGALAFALIIPALILSHKWVAEVEEDLYERRSAGLEPLLRNRLGLSLYISPTFVLRYRYRLFRDEWSRYELLARSWNPSN